LKGIHKKNALSEAFSYVKLDINDKKPVSKYSLGMKQRLGIARTLINEPEVLILDEPVNGLDPSGIKEMRSLFKRLSVEKNITIFFSSHILSEVELLADRVGIIDNGSILEEVNLKKLKSENNSYFDLTVSDSSKACKILETELDIFDYKILNNKDIRIHDIDHDISIINKTLIYNDVMVYRLNKDSKSLESYFLNVVRREK
jgi:ABC-type multidrug transport system ATPase subunit